MLRSRAFAVMAVCCSFLAGAAVAGGPDADFQEVPEIGEPVVVAQVNPKAFRHPTCEIMPWGILATIQPVGRANYSWGGDADIQPLFEAKGYKPLVSREN